MRLSLSEAHATGLSGGGRQRQAADACRVENMSSAGAGFPVAGG